MSGFHFLGPSWTAGATATANSNASSELTAANLLRVIHSWYWQSAGLTVAGAPLRITLDAGEARPWNTVGLLYTNAYDGTVRVTSNASTGTLFSAPSYSSSTQALIFPGAEKFPDRDVWVDVATTQTHRYIGIEIADTDNPDGFFRAGVVMAGVRFSPKIGPEMGSSHGYDDPSVAVELMSGEEIVRPKRSKRVGSWTFPKQEPAEKETWIDINFTYGNKIPVIFKWEPHSSTAYQQHTIIYGFMQWRSGGAFVHSVARGRYDVQVGIREV